MTDFDALYAQARDVLMQNRAIPEVYVAPSGVRTPCSLIRYTPEAARAGGQGQQPAELADRMTVELPTDPGELGVACVELAGQFVIDGSTWGIESIPSGPPGMHRVMLKRGSRTTHAGRGR